jgi:histidinol phosphatase-like enzyme
MIKNLNRKWFIDMKKSYFIGDQKSDQLMAKKAKLNFNFPEQNLYYQIKRIISK